MKKLFSLVFTCFFCVLLCMTCSAQSNAGAKILDMMDAFTADEEDVLFDKASETAAKTGMNIVIAITDDVGTPKTDAHVVDYADDLYEEHFGINTDGILLLINNDTKYDYISTSGVAINYFSDSRISSTLDYIFDFLKNERFYDAALRFINRVEYYYDNGKANTQTEILGIEMEPTKIMQVNFYLVPVALIIGFCLYFGFLKKYRLEKPKTRNYILDNSLHFDVKTDDYQGIVTTRIYSPRSSGSSSHRSGGSHRSSTHHSHSGGRHGGGGRHR